MSRVSWLQKALFNSTGLSLGDRIEVVVFVRTENFIGMSLLSVQHDRINLMCGFVMIPRKYPLLMGVVRVPTGNPLSVITETDWRSGSFRAIDKSLSCSLRLRRYE